MLKTYKKIKIVAKYLVLSLFFCNFAPDYYVFIFIIIHNCYAVAAGG